MEFKIGDRVKCIDTGSYRNLTKGDSFYSRFILAKGYKPKKPLKPTHLVVWDEGCGDPTQFFQNEKEAKDFIKELSEKSSVVKDSIILVEIKSSKKVTISKQLRYTKHEI